MSSLTILAINFAETLPLLRSVATAKTISQNVSHTWRPIDLNVAFNLRGEVGMWETNIPRGRELRAEIDKATHERAVHLVRIASQGPLPLVKWLIDQMILRDNFLDNYVHQVSAFRTHNQETLSALGTGVAALKTARFAANVGLIAGGVAVGLYGASVAVGSTLNVAAVGGQVSGAAGIAVPLIGLTKSVSVAVIKEWASAPKAQMVAIGFEVTKAGANEGAGYIGQRIAGGKGVVGTLKAGSDAELKSVESAARASLERTQQQLVDSEAKLRRMQQQRVGGESVKGAKARVARQAQQRGVIEANRRAVEVEERALVEAEQRIVRHAARAHWLRLWGAGLMRGSTVSFALWDSYDAIKELGE